MTLYVFVPIEAAKRFGIWHPDPTKPTGYWDSTVWSAPEGSLVAVAAAHFLNTTGATGEHSFRMKYGTHTGPMYYVLETK